jgi:putative flippase GtrA
MIFKIKNILAYFYQHPFIRYVFVGGTTFIIDFSILFILHGKLGIGLVIATSIAYWTSILYNFSLNRNWTFSANEKNALSKHILMYGLLLGFNYVFTVVFVSVVSHYIYFGTAKILAVGIQISWTYFIYKKIIFLPKVRNEI